MNAAPDILSLHPDTQPAVDMASPAPPDSPPAPPAVIAPDSPAPAPPSPSPSSSSSCSSSIPFASPPAPSSSSSSSIPFAAAPPAPRARNGKVARLPKALRDQLNQMLLDGVPAVEIISRLGESGSSLNHVNIVHWKAGGYRDWLKEQQLLDQSRARFELTLDLARETQGIDSFNATHKLIAAQICETLAEVGPDALRSSLAASPMNLFRMLNALARLTAGGLKCERHLADAADRQAKIDSQDQPATKKGLTPGTLHQMEDALHLM